MASRSGWLIDRPDPPRGIWELLTPNADDKLVHLRRSAALAFSAPEVWNYEAHIRGSAFRGPHKSATAVLTNSGSLEVVATQEDGKVAHFSFSSDSGWVGPVMLPVRAAGFPALIQSRFGNSGNLELIVPTEGGGLSHLWRDRDIRQIWHEARRPTGEGNWSGVSLIHSSYGNLEIVGVRDGRLWHSWQAGAGGAWTLPLDINPQAVRGCPAFIQSSFGHAGNFEVIAARADDGLQHFWRDNDAPNLQWHDGGRFAQGPDGHVQRFDDVTLLQSGAGPLEVLARTTDKRLQHFRSRGGDWCGPIDLLLPNGSLDE